MSTKTTKSTKKSTVNIEWPTGHFTIDDMQAKYPDVVNITLRFKINRAVDTNQIVEIGKIKPAIGRPKKVFAKANPSKELMDAAKTAGVIFTDEKATVPVAELKTEKKMPKKDTAAIPTTAVATSPSN